MLDFLPAWVQGPDAVAPLPRGFYVFLISLVLALLELEIEGPHGWAEKLPTRRCRWKWVERLAGKPVTGYHACFLSMLALFFHFPLLYAGFSVEREAELLCLFCVATVFWDFLWFSLNPHFGLRRFRRGEIWWFPTWLGPLPSAYWGGLVAGLAFWIAPAFLRGGPALARRAAGYGLLLAEFSILAAAVIAGWTLCRRLRRKPTEG